MCCGLLLPFVLGRLSADEHTMMLTRAFIALASTTTPTTTTTSLYTSTSSTPESTTNMSIICAGLSCLDLQLVGCTQSGSEEAIERYDEAVHCAGGSASMTGTTLALLLRGDAESEEAQHQQQHVHILTKIGKDFAGTTLLEFYRRAGASSRLVLEDEGVRTSMAVLPVYQNGKRGCFVNLASNDGFEVDELLGQVDAYFDGDGGDSTTPIQPPRAFLFGYPHLMPKMQGNALSSMLESVRQKLSLDGKNNVLMGVDLNGVDGSDADAAKAALIPALGQIDVLHLNEDEAAVLSSSKSSDENDNVAQDVVTPQLLSQIASFHEQGCAVVLLSLGSKGSFVSVTSDIKRLQQLSSTDCSTMAMSQWTPGTQVRVPAFEISHGDVNANGAGDALFSGFCLAASSWGYEQQCEEWKVTPKIAGEFASLVAWQRCDAKTRDGVGMSNANALMKMIRKEELPYVLEK